MSFYVTIFECGLLRNVNAIASRMVCCCVKFIALKEECHAIVVSDVCTNYTYDVYRALLNNS